MKKHEKHTKLSEPTIGHFGRNEWAFVGAPCGLIKNLVLEISQLLAMENTVYIDADHAEEPTSELSINAYTDKIKFERFDRKKLNSFDKKIGLSDQDLILVNGNHFEADTQIVLIHPKKEESLKRRIHQLKNVKAFVLFEEQLQAFGWLKEHLPAFDSIPTFKASQVQDLAFLIKDNSPKPAVKGLILAGGKSTRMGQDKALLNYHGTSQVAFLQKAFSEIGVTAYLSCREEQFADENRIVDQFVGLGPYGAILSAFQQDPNAAWLVVACDLPFVNSQVLQTLIEKRNFSRVATAYFNENTGFPDPLITLWEPKSYLRLLQFMALGYTCPRKVLINSEIELINPASKDILKNINTPSDMAEIWTSLTRIIP